jgi:hypothetical protein
MRIVPDLKHTYQCPNCTGLGLLRTVNEYGREYLVCSNCREEIYENETTCSEEETIKKQKKKDDFIFEMREEIIHLTWSIHDARSMALVENIQNILNRIIDYIEEN